MVWFVALLALAGCAGSEREIHFPQYAATVRVLRDTENQPSIVVDKAPDGARADLALFEMQGYVAAEDRWMQMDLVRRMSTGRLAELFGERARARDLRQIGSGLRLAAERNEARIQKEFPETWRILEAYTAGVNRYLDEVPRRDRKLCEAYERITRQVGCPIDRWTPRDSIAVTLSVSFYLSTTLEEKLILSGIAQSFIDWVKFLRTKEVTLKPGFGELFDLRPIHRNAILDQADHNPRPWERVIVPDSVPPPSMPLAANFGCLEAAYPSPGCSRPPNVGSNSWGVAPEAAGGRHGFVANDPHLPLSYPGTLYEVALDSTPAGGSFHVSGFILAGVPGVLLGQNGTVAWAFTNLPADVDDIYIEQLDERGENVKFKGAWVPVEKREVKLGIRQLDGSLLWETRTLTIVPHHGPVFSDHIVDRQVFVDGIKTLRGLLKGAALSYRWTGHEGTGELPALLAVNRAKSWEEYKRAVHSFQAGAQNMVFLDIHGNLRYIAPGRYPIRPYAVGRVDWPPFIPQMGDGSAEWAGYREEIPLIENPKDGIIVTANNDVWGHAQRERLSDYRDYFSFAFSTGARARRIREVLEADRGSMSLETMRRAQFDHTDLTVKAFAELVEAHRAFLDPQGEAKAAADRLIGFDARMVRTSQTALLAGVWLDEIVNAYWKRHPKRQHYSLPTGVGLLMIANTAYHRLREGLEQKSEEARHILLTSLENARKELKRRGLEGASWGSVHTHRFVNPFEGFLPLPVVFPIERDGSLESVDVSGPGYGANFRMIHIVGPSGIESYVSVPGGNYKPDERYGWMREIKRWREGELRPLVCHLR
jgi:penicillin amidase